MLVAVAHGTGRGWIVELLQKLLGPWNCTKTKMSDLVNSPFNNFLNRSILCAIEEVRESNERFGISDKVRDTLTENYLEVNVKYGAKRTQPIYTNFFFMTNHPDALVLKPEDRRINVFSGPSQAKDTEYYNTLYAMLDNKQFIAEVYSYLMELDLSDYNWTHSFDTPARRNMIDFNMTPEEELFCDFMSNPPAVAMTFAQIRDYLSDKAEFGSEIDDYRLKKLLQQYATPYKAIKVNGATVRPWVLTSNGAEIAIEDVKKAVALNFKNEK
ncbi:primase-helicase family protein [Gallibacterium sp. AGMB14963]|uniref:primase-helicase family protein n=1 Tax=Gallibacterium faecale TaxID=3019086 RepID=UPI0022F197CC|nr:primase-helicase family protein [Gallibacterium sp. AGMB14963]MDA3979856.1 DUF5906 domain-containing protein [Gallibacterium sp. AGMB14963]